MTVAGLRHLEQRFLSDAKINVEEARKLLEATRDYGGLSVGERTELSALIKRNVDKLDEDARVMLEDFLANAVLG